MKKSQKQSITNLQINSAYCDSHAERSRSLPFVIFFLFLSFSLHSYAQKTDAFARVSVTPREGVVRQPYKITITVHSSTWFAKPLQFANLQIDDAFIIPFTRTVSSINYINKKKYATLSFYYLVFPYNTGMIEIPELEISASIPPEGGFKGEPVTIRTKVQTIKISSIPAAQNKNVWMVATNLNLDENWSMPLNKLKVGDVIERVITISASGTLPSLIQPFEIEKPESTSIYPAEPELQDKRTNENVNGVRVERYSYLFEKEGEITIPEEEILWWNPQTKQVYKRTLPGQKLTIAFNPDLALMQSLKDSLLALSAPVVAAEEKEQVPALRIGFIVFLVLIIVYSGVKLFLNISKRSKAKRAVYLQSEFYFYQQMLKAIDKKSSTDTIRKLYVWFDRARKPRQAADISSYLSNDEVAVFQKLIQGNDQTSNKNFTSAQKKEFIALVKEVRNKILNPAVYEGRSTGLNPV